MEKRHLDISIISDVHLGAYACRRAELLQYLESIQPDVLILNGDFIDSGYLRKRALSKFDRKVVKQVLYIASQGAKVYYISNNAEAIQKNYPDFLHNNILFRDQLELRLQAKKYWIFHGSTLSKMESGSFRMKWNYFFYTLKNTFAKSNKGASGFKNGFVKTENFVRQFEQKIIQLASQSNNDYVVYGHTHQPTIQKIQEGDNTFTLMNAGDWINHLSALEYRFGQWKIYEYDESDYNAVNPKLHVRSRRKSATEKKGDKVEQQKVV